VGLTSNASQTQFGLRIEELDLTAPMALSTGIVGNIVGGSAALDLASCNQSGTGTMSWLLQFDTAAQTLQTGGAKPVSDPTQGYSFDTETISGINIAPVTFPGVTPGASGAFSTSAGQSLNLPIFLNATGTSVLILPFHELTLSGTLSSSNDCIGSYNAAGLDPANSCNPDSTHPLFNDGGQLSAYISLEEADSVIITAANESLCVLLSGNATMYGTPSAAAGGANVCKRDSNGNILYQGDWCSTTNAAAASGCSDAVSVAGHFAAGSIAIN
jgi:hypothetical protein